MDAFIAGLFGGTVEKLITLAFNIVLLAIISLVLTVFANVILNLLIEIYKAPTIAFPLSESDPSLQFIRAHTAWYGMFFFVLSILIVSMRMMFARSSYHNFKGLIRGIFTYVIIVGSAVNCITLAVQAGDDFAKWILDDLGKISIFNDQDPATLITGAVLGNGVIMFIVAIIGIIMVLVDWIVMCARDGILAIMIALLPLAASLSSITFGFNYVKRYITWIICFILYKPIAAIMIAYSLHIYKHQASVNSQDFSSYLKQSVYIVAILIMTFVTLPSIVKLLTPLNSPFDGSGSVVSSLVGFAAGFAVFGPAGGAAAEEGGAAALGSGGGGGGGVAAAPMGGASSAMDMGGGSGGGGFGGSSSGGGSSGGATFGGSSSGGGSSGGATFGGSSPGGGGFGLPGGMSNISTGSTGSSESNSGDYSDNSDISEPQIIIPEVVNEERSDVIDFGRN